MTHPKMERELELEQLSLALVHERAEAEADRSLADTAGGKRIVSKAMQESTDAFQAKVEEWMQAQEGKRRTPNAYKYLRNVPAASLAFITARRMVGTMCKEIPYRKTLHHIAQDVLLTAGFLAYRDKDKAGFNDAMRKLNWHQRTYVRYRIAEETLENECIEIEATQQEQLAIATTLVELFCQSTGLFEAVLHYKRAKDSERVLVPTEKGKAWLEEALDQNKNAAPIRLPMVIPPSPWTEDAPGGYILNHQYDSRLVRRYHNVPQSLLEGEDLTIAREAVNAIQATPWTLNKQVVDVWRQLVGTGLAGCSSSDDLKLPPLPDKDDPTRSEAGQQRAEIREANADNRSRRFVETNKEYLARLMADDEEFYFPHSLDFRGRVYPMAGSGSISPQGDDSGRAMLKFARGKALGPDGLQWLYIHAQNCWGNDKVNLQARIDATSVDLDKYLRFAADPLQERGWMEADKPFSFLAVCFELAALEDWMVIGGNAPETFESHLPVALDGSCSGLQHFAGLMRDPKTARAVNVIQARDDRSADIYTLVAEAVLRRLQEDDSLDSAMVLYWRGKVTRDLVKQPVMTLSYGVTQNGMKSQIQEKCKKFVRKGKTEYYRGTRADAAAFLARLVEAAVSDIATGAPLVMQWLADAAAAKATEVRSLEGAFSWTTPTGMKVVQPYFDVDRTRFTVVVEGKEHKFVCGDGAVRVKKSKQRRGAAPNYVHSMDASHLMLTVLGCVEHGIEDFAMIHDSFATHAADTGSLFEILRDEFAAMYQTDWLGLLYLEQPPEVKAVLPPPPALGDLDLAAVRTVNSFLPEGCMDAISCTDLKTDSIEGENRNEKFTQGLSEVNGAGSPAL